MKKILYIFFILIFIFPFKVLAIENRFTFGNNVDGLIVPTSAYFYKNNNGSLILGTNNDSTIGYFQSGDYIPTGYGTALGFSLNTPVSPDFYYALTIYGGASKNVNTYIKPASYYSSNSLYLHIGQFVGDAVNRFGSNTANVSYSQTIYDQLALQINNSNTGDYANYIVYIFKPNISGTAILVPLEFYPSSATGMIFYGYTLQTLGNANNLSSSDIQNVISSSGLATATSISEVKSSINTAKQEITTKIEQEEKKTQQAIDKVDNTLKDSDIDNSDANSFFDGFSNPDHGGISGVITSPLKLFEKIDSSCQPISFDFIGEEVTLPCGDTLFWDKEGMQPLKVVWNVIIGGPLLYFLLLKLFKTIESLKNPDDDKIEVMKL